MHTYNFFTKGNLPPDLHEEKIRHVMHCTGSRKKKAAIPTMHETDAILRLIEENADLTEIRLRIADEIIRQLNLKRYALGTWEVAHFTNAIGSLSINLTAPAQPSTAWLKTCIIDLEKALLPPDERNDVYISHTRMAESLNYEQLMQAVQTVRQQIDRHDTAARAR